ncbi:MAG: glycosyl transferase family 1 [Ignavibacteria bacterium]|nr:MAG: glycosyl transferase family 1 [Ignavibacteria bacterium]
MLSIDSYAAITGNDVIEKLRQIAKPLQGMKVVHVNSTRIGGGVAEILHKMVPLMNDLGLDTHWEVLQGNAEFYQCTKGFHNAIQGNPVHLPESLLKAYEQTNAENAEMLRPALEDADIVIIHDPQPAPLLKHFPDRKGKWIWRCHIDASRPYRPVWKYLRSFLTDYDASIWSLSDFAQPLPHPQYLIPPSIDPLSDKNVDLEMKEIRETRERFELDPERPLITQISRFDRFKDPVGVVQAYRLAKRFTHGLQLVLAGGGATDDPEGDAVLNEVYEAAASDPDVHILLLPADAHRTINALQRMSDIVLQKSTKEGFGLTVTEALWKGRPVIGGNTGGIRLQVINHHTGFLVSTPEGAALRTRYLLNHRDLMEDMGSKARQYVRDNFLLTRHIAEYFNLMVLLSDGHADRVEL